MNKNNIPLPTMVIKSKRLKEQSVYRMHYRNLTYYSTSKLRLTIVHLLLCMNNFAEKHKTGILARFMLTGFNPFCEPEIKKISVIK
jgi:hypothetical protein